MPSIRERTSASATTYQVLFRHGSKQRSKTFENKKAAETFAIRIDLDGVEAALASLKPPPPPGITVGEVATRWFEARQADVDSGALTPRVLSNYRRDYANWIGPTFGHLPAKSVTELDVQAWVDKIKTRKGSSPATVATRHSILHGIFRWASDPRRALVPRNPCVGTELPKRVRKPPKGLRLPEVHALIASARKINPDGADLIEFLAGTGWRIGEAKALTVAQVDDDGDTVYVTMERVWRREAGFVASAKSAAGYRRLRLLSAATAVVRRRVVGKAPGDLVFTTKSGTPWEDSNFRRSCFGPAAKAAGLVGERRPTPHWLRHSHVFICHAAGMSMAEIQRRIGHEDIRMTINIYGRLIDDMNDDVATRLDALLTPAALPAVVIGEVQSSREDD